MRREEARPPWLASGPGSSGRTSQAASPQRLAGKTAPWTIVRRPGPHAYTTVLPVPASPVIASAAGAAAGPALAKMVFRRLRVVFRGRGAAAAGVGGAGGAGGGCR